MKLTRNCLFIFALLTAAPALAEPTSPLVCRTLSNSGAVAFFEMFNRAKGAYWSAERFGALKKAFQNAVRGLNLNEQRIVETYLRKGGDGHEAAKSLNRHLVSGDERKLRFVSGISDSGAPGFALEALAPDQSYAMVFEITARTLPGFHNRISDELGKWATYHALASIEDLHGGRTIFENLDNRHYTYDEALTAYLKTVSGIPADCLARENQAALEQESRQPKRGTRSLPMGKGAEGITVPLVVTAPAL
jgi:hypothetical protein